MNAAILRARLLIGQSRWEMAQNELRHALTEDVQDAEAHALLGFCLAQLEKYAEAEDEARQLVELYGAGLARITEIVGEDESGPKLMDKLVADPLVESLLLVHDLHPLDTSARVRRVSAWTIGTSVPRCRASSVLCASSGSSSSSRSGRSHRAGPITSRSARCRSPGRSCRPCTPPSGCRRT